MKVVTIATAAVGVVLPLAAHSAPTPGGIPNGNCLQYQDRPLEFEECLIEQKEKQIFHDTRPDSAVPHSLERRSKGFGAIFGAIAAAPILPIILGGIHEFKKAAEVVEKNKFKIGPERMAKIVAESFPDGIFPHGLPSNFEELLPDIMPELLPFILKRDGPEDSAGNDTDTAAVEPRGLWDIKEHCHNPKGADHDRIAHKCQGKETCIFNEVAAFESEACRHAILKQLHFA